jgi:hypothetical protein
MIFRRGVGRLRTKVGTATIWCPLANCGVFSRSMTSIRYLPLRCSSQTRLRLAKASSDFGVYPATYSRRSHRSSVASGGTAPRLPDEFLTIGSSFRA